MFLLVVTVLFAARAQSSISFPITLQHVAPSVIGPGIYAISSLNAEGTEYFMTSSLYPNSKKGTKLKGERCVVDADEHHENERIQPVDVEFQSPTRSLAIIAK